MPTPKKRASRPHRRATPRPVAVEVAVDGALERRWEVLRAAVNDARRGGASASLPGDAG